jgi:hypothetical protein
VFNYTLTAFLIMVVIMIALLKMCNKFRATHKYHAVSRHSNPILELEEEDDLEGLS